MLMNRGNTSVQVLWATSLPNQTSSSPVCLGRAERLENDIDNSTIPRDDPGSGYKRTKIHSIVLYESLATRNRAQTIPSTDSLVPRCQVHSDLP
ncbi:hypothetical protein ASPFODRAFT_276732 [Aspergillus luchuensis CBS 106.47]|uniref:Uncharacterized protein n=1 Tax=Aspergillus luchuensis (strain CBS 106.47) TaxID=1137211 RepID=A0A1M3U187_ASPLC|nr:hypothetical protein ASPFODRAFT_276732 [Aspergillus luchuensis CBS 106.47]